MSDNGDNMKLWNQVSVTNPDHTKPVSYGQRHFTAIDAYHQIQRATELFGPVGVGWGWDASLRFEGDVCCAVVDMWHSGEREKRFTVMGSAKVGNDGEAPKKALTDAITKGLSYLGFNADVFMGLYDDNKYVAALRAANAANRLTGTKLVKWVDEWRGNHGSSLDGHQYTSSIVVAQFPSHVPGTTLTEGQLLTVRACLQAGKYDKVTGNLIPTEAAPAA